MCLVCIFFFFFFISYIFRERNGEKKKNYIPRTFLVVIQKGVSCGHGQTSKIRYTPWQDRRLLLVQFGLRCISSWKKLYAFYRKLLLTPSKMCIIQIGGVDKYKVPNLTDFVLFHNFCEGWWRGDDEGERTMRYEGHFTFHSKFTLSTIYCITFLVQTNSHSVALLFKRQYCLTFHVKSKY